MTFFVVKNLGGSGQSKVKKFSDVGLQEPFMSRLFDFTRLVDGLIIDDAAKKKNIKDEIIRMIFEGFEPAFVSLGELQEAGNSDDYPDNKTKKHAKDVITYLVIAYKDRMQKVANALGYDICFLYSNELNFEKGADNFTQKHQRIGKEIVNKMRENRSTWQRILFDIRNILINHQMNSDQKEIEELKIYLNYKGCKKLFDNSWQAAEEILFMLFYSLAPINEVIKLREIDNYINDHQSIHRFGWYIENNKISL